MLSDFRETPIPDKKYMPFLLETGGDVASTVHRASQNKIPINHAAQYFLASIIASGEICDNNIALKLGYQAKQTNNPEKIQQMLGGDLVSLVDLTPTETKSIRSCVANSDNYKQEVLANPDCYKELIGKELTSDPALIKYFEFKRFIYFYEKVSGSSGQQSENEQDFETTRKPVNGTGSNDTKIPEINSSGVSFGGDSESAQVVTESAS